MSIVTEHTDKHVVHFKNAFLQALLFFVDIHRHTQCNKKEILENKMPQNKHNLLSFMIKTKCSL